MASTRTSSFRKGYWITLIITLLLNIGPLVGYIVKALIEADLAREKLVLSLMIVVVLMLTLVSIANKIALRSRLWLILIGLYYCLDYIITPLIIIAVCQVVDELLITPLHKYYKTRLVINKEMDKRI